MVWRILMRIKVDNKILVQCDDFFLLCQALFVFYGQTLSDSRLQTQYLLVLASLWLCSLLHKVPSAHSPYNISSRTTGMSILGKIGETDVRNWSIQFFSATYPVTTGHHVPPKTQDTPKTLLIRPNLPATYLIIHDQTQDAPRYPIMNPTKIPLSSGHQIFHLMAPGAPREVAGRRKSRPAGRSVLS